MTNVITVKDAKAKLLAIVEELNKFDDNAKFCVELDDNCGGSYVDDMSNWNVNVNAVGECWLSNF